MDNNFRIVGTVLKIVPKDKFSQVILKYLNGSRPQEVPFTAGNQRVNDLIHDLQPGSEVELEFQPGGSEWKGNHYATNYVNKIID